MVLGPQKASFCAFCPLVDSAYTYSKPHLNGAHLRPVKVLRNTEHEMIRSKFIGEKKEGIYHTLGEVCRAQGLTSAMGGRRGKDG
jgi:hypothetical protein